MLVCKVPSGSFSKLLGLPGTKQCQSGDESIGGYGGLSGAGNKST